MNTEWRCPATHMPVGARPLGCEDDLAHLVRQEIRFTVEGATCPFCEEHVRVKFNDAEFITEMMEVCIGCNSAACQQASRTWTVIIDFPLLKGYTDGENLCHEIANALRWHIERMRKEG